MKERSLTRRDFLKFLLGTLSTLPPMFLLGRKFIDEAKGLGSNTSPEEVPLPIENAESLVVSQTPKSAVEAEAKTGIEFLRSLGFEDKIVYIVYGRPQKYEGQRTWGSLGSTRTAEESWQIVQNLRGEISQEIGKSNSDFALNILNPVYRSVDGVIQDIYIQKALALAGENQGLVALNFNSISEAGETLQRLEGVLPKDLLPYLAVGLDIEYFPNRKTTAEEINDFSSWFAEKHKEWARGLPKVPGVIILYTLHGSPQAGEIGRILGLDRLRQYYLDGRTLVVPIFDGYGSRGAKLAKMDEIINSLPNTSDFPALLGVMEFNSRWGDKYDSCNRNESFSTLVGAPVFFFASQ